MKSDQRNKLAVVVSLLAVLLAALHIAMPSLTIDNVTLLLLFFAIVPWLGYLLKEVELPGGIKVTYQDLEEKAAEIAEAGLLSKTVSQDISHKFNRLKGEDPNLALAGLRIEIEKSLRKLLYRYGTETKTGSIFALTRELAKRNIISEGACSALLDLTNLLNKAVHGAKVDKRAIDWAMSIGPQILTTLNETGNQKNI